MAETRIIIFQRNNVNAEPKRPKTVIQQMIPNTIARIGKHSGYMHMMTKNRIVSVPSVNPPR